MKATVWFYAQGQRRGATGRAFRGPGGCKDWWPAWAQNAFAEGWHAGRIARSGGMYPYDH